MVAFIWWPTDSLKTDYSEVYTKGAFHLSELTGEPIPIIMRISLLIKLTIQIGQILNIKHK